MITPSRSFMMKQSEAARAKPASKIILLSSHGGGRGGYGSDLSRTGSACASENETRESGGGQNVLNFVFHCLPLCSETT